MDEPKCWEPETWAARHMRLINDAYQAHLDVSGLMNTIQSRNSKGFYIQHPKDLLQDQALLENERKSLHSALKTLDEFEAQPYLVVIPS
jgi:hypothetical protein